MLQFIFLGYIPGTSIQLDFISYMLAVLLAGTLLFAAWYYKARAARRLTEQFMLNLMAL